MAILINIIFSSFLYVNGIYGYVKTRSDSLTNSITLSNKTSYTVIYELMNLDGETYTELENYRETYNDVLLGTVVSPEVAYSFTGFDSPQRQTVTLSTYEHVTIRYRYNRKRYNLVIENSEYVNSYNTPSGSYLYGTEIHLTASETNNYNNSFLKWSNNETNRDYTFILTNNTTIGPIYTEPYIVTFEPNNGDPQTTKLVIKGESIGTIPDIRYDDCVGKTGDYLTRQCTYFYQFEGWYKEPIFVNQVDSSFVPTGDTTLYAKWDKIFFSSPGTTTFDGTNYINTGIQLFTEEHASKDFIVTFTVDSNNGFVNERGTIFTNMREKADPWPGVQFFVEGNSPNYTFAMNANRPGEKFRNDDTGYTVGDKVIIKKENGIVYYSFDDGPFIRINDFSNFTSYFDDYATFGAGTNSSGGIYRYFKGTLTDMSVELKEAPSYTIVFNANGGTGTMADQTIRLGASEALSANAFTNNDCSFGGWNTAADGSGTSYTNKEIVSNLGNDGDVITLYAQWIEPIHYYVHFDANGGTGTMPDQRFNYDSIPVPLDGYDFTRPGYIFKGWNTAADGSGTAYQDEEQVCDLTDVPDGIVTLYAQYRRIAYENSGDIVFDGTANTFIDTGVNVFSTTNFNKDFEIRFTFKSIDSDVFDYTPEQPTMFNVKDESNNKYPGFNIRFNGGVNTMTPTYRWGGNTVNKPSSGIATSNSPIEFVYRRVGNNITMEYSYGGNTYRENLFNQTSWTLNQDFATNVAFGGYFNSSNQPGRFFKGTLADIIIIIDE